jgi:predicted glycoside hydrolase/deacetylase ChbG (UPF0249 family)
MSIKVGKPSGKSPAAYLIVNADDYGYYAGVSRGILDGARDGLIRATGVMANSDFFDEHVGWLGKDQKLDVGVHLNLTHGRPLTHDMVSALDKWEGNFPGKYRVVGEIVAGRLSVKCVENEWQKQIRRCIDAGLKPVFLNTHEHLHMYPALFMLICSLADQHGIPFIRYSGPEWNHWVGAGGLLRNTLLQVMHMIDRKRAPLNTPVLLGMSGSGKLDISYMQKCLARLQPGITYELMCHPGYCYPDEVLDQRLLSYHHWEQELELLKSESLKEICREAGVECVSYSDVLSGRVKTCS